VPTDPRVSAEDVATIRRSRWLLPLVLEPVALVMPFSVYDSVADKSSATRAAAWSVFGVAAVVALLPFARSQYLMHRDGFNARRRPRSKDQRQVMTSVLVAFGLLLPWVPTIPKALIAGAALGGLQGAVLGSEVAYARLLRFAARG
jgi:membrane protein YqaA with SNARE-associated domain